MPNRIIKDSICTSENLDTLSPMAECLFYRLLVTVDDFGCYHGNPSIIKSNCFPLKSDDIKREQVKAWVDELIAADLIREYVCKDDGRHYIQFTKWQKHQNTRAQKPKYPLPDDNCEQMHADAPDIRIRNTYSLFDIRNRESNTGACAREEEPPPTIQDDGFDKFWDTYPSTSGDIRQACKEYMLALEEPGVTREVLQSALEAQIAASTEKDMKFFPSADKWLRNRTWRKKIPKKSGGTPHAFTPTEFG